MVLINDKKFACATCIKGHRVSGCTHTDRPLFEVKKKGRPTTQCQHCRDKRKVNGSVGQVHTKCACGDPKSPDMIMPGSNTSSAAPSKPPETAPPPTQSESDIETRKGVPGSKATFPNGLKDVHDMAAAAEALSGLGYEEQTLKVAERKVANLLNPCQCQSGGPCKCCQPKRERSDSRFGPSPNSGLITPGRSHSVTDGLIEMFQTKATTSATPPEGSCCSSGASRPTISTNTKDATWAQLMQPKSSYLSPDNMHHPSHTSPHVHKTKLYSPYSTSGHSTPRHGRRGDASPGGHRVGGWASSSNTRPAPPKLKPISDMNKLLGAVFKEDGTVAETIPRSALGLPGIKAFDAVAQNGGVKFESMDMDVDMPIQFPTHEDVVIGACTCGEDCECSGCATHGIPPRTSDGHNHEGGCGENCKSSFDCADHLSLPSGITSIGHLLSLAAANVPPPAQKRPLDLSGHAHDTRILPPAVSHSEDAARAAGVVTLKPLECCNGRCQCPAGKCVCEKECCGCCIRCACDEEGDSKMNGNTPTQEPASCCSTAPAQPEPVSTSCCSTGSSTRHPSPARSNTATPQHTASAPLLSPDSTSRPSRQPSPLPSAGSVTPNLRRAASTIVQQPSGQNAVARRATVTTGSGLHRSASTGKQASKALALHTTPNHPHSATHTVHPRPILPKPPSHGSQVNLVKSARGSRIPSPSHATAPSSSQSSRHASPAVRPVNIEPPQQQLQLPEPIQSRDASMFPQSLPDQAAQPMPNASQNMQNQNQPTSYSGFGSDEDFMAFINQFQNDSNNAPPSSSEGSLDMPLTTPDVTTDGQLFDRFFMPNGDMGSNETNFDPELLALIENAVNGSNGTSDQVQTTFNPSQPLPPTFDFGGSAFGQQDHAAMANAASTGLRTQLDLANPSMINSGFGSGLPDLFGNGGQSFSSAAGQLDNAEPVYRQLPLHLQQALGQNPAFASMNNGSKSQASGNNGQNNEPNLIDLSKPLNAADVERILRALQDQQAKSPPAASQQSQLSGISTPSHRLSNASSIASSGVDRMMMPQSNQYGQVQPPQYQPMPDQSLIPQQPVDPVGQPNNQSFDQNFNPFASTDELLERYLRDHPEYLEDAPQSNGVEGMPNWDLGYDLGKTSGQVGLETFANSLLEAQMRKGTGS